MITVYVGAGLANRMFQYSFALYLKNKGLNVNIDEHSFKPRFDFENTKLSNVFNGIELKESDYRKFRYSFSSKKIEKKILNYYHLITEKLPDYRYIVRWTLDYLPDIYMKATPNCIFVGFWISYKYFNGIENQIKQSFIFKDFSSKKNLEIATKIRATNSVAVHFRKNVDYLKEHADECTPQYYANAIEYIKKHVDNPTFYFFSDNWDWVKKNIHGVDYVPIDWNSPSGPESHCDMQLMSMCKHNIIANSTYSWWAAWFNENKNKIVVCPDYWFYFLKDINTLVPQEWVKLNSKAL